ncbi:hypothetical protein EDC02_6907 [Micromonospora sp. Llam0]|uniref:hypothetical protein n=1 Tax=Micromonospora sp. Llam0 TaxID=2485143 RepID=UPI000FA56A09|nr:hypothetical protein [Micromonospora sp. Llam0]ROO52012.1 hypothetical protein EDC02_6907 [Micromonospora sp. Llam0]
MRIRDLVEDLAITRVAGYPATRVMEPVSTRLYQLESPQNRAREDAARPGAPYRIVARSAHRCIPQVPCPQRYSTSDNSFI